MGCCIEGSSGDTRLWVTTVATGTCRSASCSSVCNACCEEISDLTLGRGAANIERVARDLARSAFGTQKLGANLRAIAMGEHDAIAGANQADDLGRGALGVGALLGDGARFARANQGVSADGKKHGLHRLLSAN